MHPGLAEYDFSAYVESRPDHTSQVWIGRQVRMNKKISAALVLAALVGVTNASAQTAGAKRGGVCIGPFRGADSPLLCEHIGKVTVRQIYEKGFRVIHMQDDKNTAAYVTLIIEEQSP
jgi:hypothetical protein